MFGLLIDLLLAVAALVFVLAVFVVPIIHALPKRRSSAPPFNGDTSRWSKRDRARRK